MGEFKKNNRFGTRNPEEMKRLIKLLQDKNKELGKRPKKCDVDSKELGAIKKTFGKWCYALEASGLAVPSPATVERRANKAKKWDRKHAAAKSRRRKKFQDALKNSAKDPCE